MADADGGHRVTGVRGPGEVPAICVDSVSYRYAGLGSGTDALRRVSLVVEPGERLGVLGPNGGGKSTLLKLMLGLLEPAEGRVEVFGMRPTRARESGLIGYVPQRTQAELRFPLSVRQAVELAGRVSLPPWRGPDGAERDSVRRLLDLVGVAPLADRAIGQLSGGQLQRAMIARALARRPRVLLLDEPMVGVDVDGQRRFAEMIDTIRRELGPAIITVSHDLRTILATSDRVACLRRDLHYHDSPSGLTTGVLAEVFSHDVEAMLGRRGAAALTAEISSAGDPAGSSTPRTLAERSP